MNDYIIVAREMYFFSKKKEEFIFSILFFFLGGGGRGPAKRHKVPDRPDGSTGGQSWQTVCVQTVWTVPVETKTVQRGLELK